MNISVWFAWPGCERSGGALGRHVPLVAATCRGRWVGTYDLAREAANAWQIDVMRRCHAVHWSTKQRMSPSTPQTRYNNMQLDTAA